MTPEDAYSLLECIAKISGTEGCLKRMKPEGHEVEDEKAAKVAEVMAKNAMLFVLNGIGDVEKAIYFNGNVNAVADKLCFLTLEGKHKWQK